MKVIKIFVFMMFLTLVPRNVFSEDFTMSNTMKVGDEYKYKVTSIIKTFQNKELVETDTSIMLIRYQIIDRTDSTITKLYVNEATRESGFKLSDPILKQGLMGEIIKIENEDLLFKEAYDILTAKQRRWIKQIEDPLYKKEMELKLDSSFYSTYSLERMNTLTTKTMQDMDFTCFTGRPIGDTIELDAIYIFDMFPNIKSKKTISIEKLDDSSLYKLYSENIIDSEDYKRKIREFEKQGNARYNGVTDETRIDYVSKASTVIDAETGVFSSQIIHSRKKVTSGLDVTERVYNITVELQ